MAGNDQERDENNSPSDEAETSAKTNVMDPVDVTMHPLVLLSAADHYHRVAKGTRKRVVGVLLGHVTKGKVDASNSFAVPFEEDSRNPVRTCGIVSRGVLVSCFLRLPALPLVKSGRLLFGS